MAILIADTACVDPRAELDDEVEVGPYCIIGPDVRIGRGTRLIGHACVFGSTVLGSGNTIHPFVVLGGNPPEVPPRGTPGQLVLGDGNVVREHVTVQGGGVTPTRIGDRNLLMAAARVAPGCTLGDANLLGDGVLLAEGVVVESHATLSAGVAVHRRVTIGMQSFLGSQGRILQDVPRYMLVDGNPARVRGVNLIGLRRRGVSKSAIDALREAYRLIYRARLDLAQAEETLAARSHRVPEVEDLLTSLRAQQEGRHGRARETAARDET